mmetsp:Transcript_33092/g.42646  ORF Transcript_33092/g.42646 Transcript_33092/m.42646 type:complete len:166 (-) Transcript_33092:325-822(-)
MSHRIAFTALLLVASACATELTPEQLEARDQERAAQVFADDPRRGEQVKNLCFASQIDSFGQTTKRAVVVREGRDHFLIETFPGCFDLDYAQGLAIDSFSSCLSKGDRIIAFDSPFGNVGHRGAKQSCLIKAIYEWDEDAGKDEADDETEETTEEEETVEVAALK